MANEFQYSFPCCDCETWKPDVGRGMNLLGYEIICVLNCCCCVSNPLPAAAAEFDPLFSVGNAVYAPPNADVGVESEKVGFWYINQYASIYTGQESMEPHTE